jgi:iron complex outermembrane receptor protein
VRLPPNLTQLGLEDLLNVEVTSVSKKAEKLWGAASAVYVITQEDTRRSGATEVERSWYLKMTWLP